MTGFKLIVGGAPITEQFAQEVGADGYSADAAGAATLAKKLSA
jgi:methanogenic corrinoid protein MtbC1